MSAHSPHLTLLSFNPLALFSFYILQGAFRENHLSLKQGLEASV